MLVVIIAYLLICTILEGILITYIINNFGGD